MVLLVDVEADIGFLVCKIRIENVGLLGGWRSEGDISLLLRVKEGDKIDFFGGRKEKERLVFWVAIKEGR